MKVTLAYEYEGHKPDQTVDLPGAEARRLLSDGRARLPEKGAEKTSTATGGTKSTPKQSGSGRQTEEE